MAKLVFDKTGERFYETGVSKGVLFVASETEAGAYEKGVAWNGLTAVTESPEGAEATAIYADNIKYLSLMSAEDFNATIEAYYYPDAFEACDGSKALVAGVKVGQQPRRKFALCYRTELGNDVNANLGYKLHIIYGALAAPAERAYATINDSPEAITFSWSISTTPIEIAAEGFKPSAHIEIDSTKVAEGKMKLIEDKLYGTDSPSGDPTLLTPDQIIELLK